MHVLDISNNFSAYLLPKTDQNCPQAAVSKIPSIIGAKIGPKTQKNWWARVSYAVFFFMRQHPSEDARRRAHRAACVRGFCGARGMFGRLGVREKSSTRARTRGSSVLVIRAMSKPSNALNLDEVLVECYGL